MWIIYNKKRVFLKFQPKDATYFYLQPKRSSTGDVTTWNTKNLMCHNTLQQMMSKMCMRAGIDGKRLITACAQLWLLGCIKEKLTSKYPWRWLASEVFKAFDATRKQHHSKFEIHLYILKRGDIKMEVIGSHVDQVDPSIFDFITVRWRSTTQNDSEACGCDQKRPDLMSIFLFYTNSYLLFVNLLYEFYIQTLNKVYTNIWDNLLDILQLWQVRYILESIMFQYMPFLC